MSLLATAAAAANNPLVQQGVIATTQAITRGGPRRQYKWNKRAAQDTNEMNRDNAIWALEENRKIQNEQRVYDSPENQMRRYKEAGLNPHLIYGGGSGNSGGVFPISTQGIAPSRIDAPSASYPDLAGSYMQAGQSLASTDLNRQKAEESEHKILLIDAQKDIAKSNPMLNKYVYQSTIFQLEAVANQKAQEARYLGDFKEGTNMTNAEYNLAQGQKKVQADINRVFQQLGLGETDQELKNLDKQIKNKILESKGYENALKELQVNWMKDGDITPQHIWQGLMLLLQRMM
ncbi:MAG: DNA pilot protein [Microviridae sp.]|nr:MAG: DNA pilot protein [Microviridae sp.]